MLSYTSTKVIRLIIFQIIFAVNFCLICYGQELIYISGKVIDTSNKVNIFLIPDCGNCPIDALETFNPDQSGYFSIKSHSKTKYYLFLEEEEPKNFWNIINYPQGTIRYLPEFRGIPIFNKKTTNIDLGNVKPTITYSKAEIDLSKLIGSYNNQDIKIQTKDLNGRIVSNKRKIDEQFWMDKSKLKIAYPKGKWILDIFVNENQLDRKLGSIKIKGSEITVMPN